MPLQWLLNLISESSEKKLKSIRPVVEKINVFEPQMKALSRRTAESKDVRVPVADREGRKARRYSSRGFRGSERSFGEDNGAAPLRRSADRRDSASSGQDLRNENRRRKDPGRHASRLPQRARRQRRPRSDGQRLPGEARQRMDGADIQGCSALKWG